MRARRQAPAEKTGAQRAMELGRDFRLYAAGQAVSIVGDRIALIALVFLVIHLSHGYAPALALFYVCRVLPSLLGGLLVGAIVDQVDRRALMISCDLARAFLLAAIPSLTALSLSSFFPVVFVLYALTLVFTTAVSAALPDIVPEIRMIAANSVLTGIGNTADIAYALGGVLVVALGYRLPFYIDAATFAFSALMIWQMRIPHQHGAGGVEIGGLPARIAAGIDFIRRNPFLRWSTIAMITAPFAGGAGYVLAPLYANQALAHSAGLFGPFTSGAFRFSALEVCLGAGSVLGSVAAPWLARRYARGHLFCVGLLGTGAADMLLGPTANLYLACTLLAANGVCFTVAMISGVTLVQTLTPTEMRGRVVAARGTAINTALLLGSAAAGLGLLALSVRVLWIVEGGIIAATGASLLFSASVRRQR